jgi:hypothetical protein
MRKFLLLFLIPFSGMIYAQPANVSSNAVSLLHYWNFNTSTSEATVLAVSSSLFGSPGITRETGGTSTIQVPGTGQNFEIENLNARNSAPAGDHLRFNNPGTGGSLTFSLPTTGYKDVTIKYASRKSSTSAAQTQNVSYSTDGTNFTNFTTIDPTETPTLYTVDFTSITAANDNANFKVRISFVQGSGGTTGNHRFDNFTIDGTSLSASDILAPTVTSANFVSSTLIVVEFNESVTSASATNTANYTVSGGITVNSIAYDNATKKATLTISPLADGSSYSVTVNNIVDASTNANTMTTAYVSATSIFNASTPPLVITEIMYNALNIPEADALEFIEIYNNSANIVKAGGLKIKDGNNFDFTLPETDIPANGFLLLAVDKAGAEAFYTGKTFLDIPATGNVLGNGGELITLRNSLNATIDEVNYDDATPWPLDADEKGFSLELLDLSLDNNLGQNWGTPKTLVKPLNGVNIYATPGSFTTSPAPVTFATERTIVNENAGSLSIPVNISFAATNAVSTQVTIVGGNAVEGVDYTFSNQTLTFAANTSAAQNVAITILDNTDPNRDKYLVLQLGTVTNGSLGSIKQHVIFIKDNDRTPIRPSNAINLSYTGNYKVPESGSSAEISAYDPASKRLFVVNSLKNKMEILDLTTPSAITRISTIDMAPYGAGLNSIATKNGIVAVAIENVGTANGAIGFFDINGALLKSVEAGNLPDMITFTPDGKSVLTANEAQPIFYTPTLSDPEGSITLVDLSSVATPADVANITQANVTQINFNAFDSQMESLKGQGVRIFGPGSSVSQDLEPKYIAVSADSKKAYVTLQENNALAIVDLVTKQVTSIAPLGYKDHSLPENALDASDQSGDVFLVNWKVKGMYMPDAIAYFEVAGTPYVITANEGDAREYTGITDEVTVGSLNLDPTAFPNAAALKLNSALGRLAVTNKLGDTDGDGDFDELYAFGARSFTIWNGTTGAKVFDSGAQFERITSEDPIWAPFFNANNSIGNPSKKNRSDNKGPEPEGVAVATIGNKQYAFIALERIGGVMTYDVTNPANPVFVGYDNNRSNPTVAIDDFGSEGIIYISAADSPTGNPLVLLSNEVSGTVSVYSIAVNPTVSLSASANNGSEATGSVITLTATASAAVTAAQTIELEVKGAGITSADYTLSSTTITIAAGATTGTATLTLLNDTELEGSEILSVALRAPSADITIGSVPRQDIFIFDNDFPAAPTTSTTDIKLTFVSSYLNVGPNPGNSAEISAYDPSSKRLYIANSLGKKLNIIDFSNPAAMTSVASIDVATYGGINSVAVRNGLVAVAIEAANLTDNGSVVFFDKDGVFLKQVTVGAMPDMITFSPNGNLVLTPNEGEPNDAYTVDPEGTVSIIDISGGIATLAQTNVTTVNFNSFDSQLAALRTQGLRVYGPNNPTLSKDVEPEYITFSADGSIAYVTLQEANAIAELNIATKTFTAIRPLGLKDHNLIKNGLDASDNGIAFPAITNLPVKGMYQPDAIASYTVNNETYLVTANEGDSRVYPRAGSPVGAEGSIYSEEVRVSAAAYVLDPVKFPNAALLKSNAVLGRLQLTNKTGDTDGDGDFDEIHALGARSFSIWKATATGLTQIFDSGDQFERITLADATYGSMFNASHDNNTAKNRSDNKGPEPEGVAISTINGKTYAFISLERIGGVMVYNVTDPANPVFVQWANSRSTTAVAGVRGSEGIFYISAKDSPTGVPLVVLSNEVSSTISVYSVGNGVLATAPTALTAVNSNTQISTTLTWTDNSSAETAFDIQRSTSETTGFVSIGSVLPNVVTYTDNSVVAGTTYFYRVRAANDFGYSNSNTVSVVTKQNQTITFGSLSAKTFGDAAFALTATTTSALAISYTSSNLQVATVSGNLVTIVGAGTTSITASQTGNISFLGATDASQTLTVAKANQTITFASIADRTLGDASFALTASTSTSGLPVTLTANSKITLTGTQVAILSAGKASVTATQTGNANYNPATSVVREFCIKPAKPTVTLSNTNTETVTLTSSAVTGNQWFLGANAIAGATNSTFSVTTPGIYKVQVKVEDCISEFSADQTIIVTGDIGSAHHSVTAFPNPVKDILTVVFESETGKKDVSITELTGKQMLRQEVNGKEATFNVQGYSQGIYLIKVLSDKGTSVIRFEKQ